MRAQRSGRGRPVSRASGFIARVSDFDRNSGFEVGFHVSDLGFEVWLFDRVERVRQGAPRLLCFDSRFSGLDREFRICGMNRAQGGHTRLSVFGFGTRISGVGIGPCPGRACVIGRHISRISGCRFWVPGSGVGYGPYLGFRVSGFGSEISSAGSRRARI